MSLQPFSHERELVNKRETDYLHRLVVIGQGKIVLSYKRDDLDKKFGGSCLLSGW